MRGLACPGNNFYSELGTFMLMKFLFALPFLLLPGDLGSLGITDMGSAL